MFCPHCGAQVSDGTAFCPKCGQSLVAPVPQPTPTSSQSGPPNPAEAAGLTKVMWTGVIQLVAIGAGWVVSYLILANFFTTFGNLNLPPNPTPAQVNTALGPLFQNMSLIIPVFALISLAALVVLTMGFRDLKEIDRRFSTPYLLMMVMIVGTLMVVAGVSVMFNSIPNIIAQAPSNSTAPTSAFFDSIGSLFTFLAVLGLGSLLSLVGAIGGEILGLWRVGSRYSENLLKVGAIFTIIPLLNIVAPILVLIGAHQAKSRLAMGH